MPLVRVPKVSVAELPVLVRVPPLAAIASVPKFTVFPYKSTKPPLLIVRVVVTPKALPAPVASVSLPPERMVMLPGRVAPTPIERVTLSPICTFPPREPGVPSVNVTADVEVRSVLPLPEREPVKTDVVGLQLNVPEFVIWLVDNAPLTVSEPAEIVVAPV